MQVCCQQTACHFGNCHPSLTLKVAQTARVYLFYEMLYTRMELPFPREKAGGGQTTPETS